MKKLLHQWCGLVVIVGILSMPAVAFSGSFGGNARVEIQDPTGGLSWSTTANALTVECWFKLSVPSTVSLSQNMTILVNRLDGNENSIFAYLIRYNISNGYVEYVTRGDTGAYTNTLIQTPYLDRWYHVAVVKSGNSVVGYVDGRQAFVDSAAVGNAANNNGVAIGGWGAGKYLYGEVQEVAVYQSALSQEFITQYMYLDQPDLPELQGYYKLAYTTNAADQLRNLSSAPPGSTTPAVAVGSVGFDQVDQGGEQSAFDSRRNGGKDALSPLSGSFAWEQGAFSRPTPGIAFDFRYAYGSGNAQNGSMLGGYDPNAASSLGKGWHHSFDARVIPGQYFDPVGGIDSLGLMMWNGSIETWDLNMDDGEYYTRHKEYRGELNITGSIYCEWTTPDRLIYRFRHPFSGSTVMRGRLVSISDYNSNTVQVLYNESIGIITQVVDTAGGRYDFKYNPQYLLTKVSFQGWSVNFEYTTNNLLAAKTLVAPSGYSNVNARWQFAYNTTNGFLWQITDPNSNSVVQVVYDKYGRQTQDIDAIGRTNTTEYGVPATRQITHTDPAGYKWIETFDRKGRLTMQTDPLANVVSYTYDNAGNKISTTDSLGYVNKFGYDSRANVLAQTNALGLVKQWAYHPFFNKATNEINELGWSTWSIYDSRGNLVTNADGRGTLAAYTYFTNGLVQTAADGNGNLTRFNYSSDGFLASKIDPATNTWTYGYNNLGWVMAETNPLTQVTSYTYDLNGKVVRKVDPLTRTYTMSYDGNGNLLAQSDAKAQLTRFYYDSANQKTQMIDRAGFSWQFQYDKRGKLWKAIDPLSNVVTKAYDPAARLVSEIDPLGNAVTNIYDANNNLLVMIDKLGQRWAKTYDRLNRVVAETDPLGNTKATAYDAAGRIKTITMPKGYISTHIYDGRGRLAIWTDAEGYVWQYDYDGNMNITNITDALNGHYVMKYGSRNERTMERNQDNFTWNYVYDPLVRLAEQTDPNGTIRDVVYDTGGRIDYVTFSTGRSDDYSYDDNNNLTTLTRAGSGAPVTLSLAYDAVDRISTCTDAFSKQVKYAYDPAGRMTNMTYPDGKTLGHFYDALGRLTNQVDWAGRTLSYTYDNASRLLTRTYPNGITQTNSFDSAGLLVDLRYQVSTLSPLIALSYAFDKNGNKSAATESGTLDWQVPVAIDETARFTASGRLIDKNDALSSNDWTYAYDPSGNMTNAVSPTKNIAFQYDEDNRVLSVNSLSLPVTTVSITNRYDALGRRIVRTLNGVQTKYVLSLAGDMERIICDMNVSGVIQTWYVHGPDLCYAVDVSGNLVCYHADAQGNIIALTDSSTNTVAKYSYTPYGRLLGSSITGNCSLITNNCYTFVGSQGVMAEIGDLYFMRARYYSSEAGVFLSTDPVKKIGPGWKPDAYCYALGNPTKFTDPEGTWVLLDDLLFISVGVVGGLVSQAMTDPLASWESYAGSVVGGVVSMESSLYMVPVAGPVLGGYASASLGGFVGDLSKQGLKNMSGKLDGIDVGHAAEESFYSGTSKLISGGLSLPGVGSGSARLNYFVGGVTKSAAKTAIKGTEKFVVDTMKTAVSTSYTQIGVSAGGGGNSSRMPSILNRTSTAGIAADNINSCQVTKPASVSVGGVSTPSVVSSGVGKSTATSSKPASASSSPSFFGKVVSFFKSFLGGRK